MITQFGPRKYTWDCKDGYCWDRTSFSHLTTAKNVYTRWNITAAQYWASIGKAATKAVSK